MLLKFKQNNFTVKWLKTVDKSSSRRSSARILYLWLKVILTSNKISSRGKYLKSNRQRFFIELSVRTSNERKSFGRKQILKQQKLVASHKSFQARRTLRARQISQINRQINNNRPQSRINFLARHQPSRDIFSKTSFAHWKAFGPLETLNGIYGIFIFSYSLPPQHHENVSDGRTDGMPQPIVVSLRLMNAIISAPPWRGRDKGPEQQPRRKNFIKVCIIVSHYHYVGASDST